MTDLKTRLTDLYRGTDSASVRFRYGLIGFDAITILFFMSTAHIPHGPWLIGLSWLAGLVIALDLVARLWISSNRRKLFWRIYTLADIIVLVSLLLETILPGGLAFLRILRGLRLIHSYHLLQDLRRDSRFFRRHEDAIIAGINLFIFVFATSMTALVFFMDTTGSDYPYIDALYFTVATLTTTGFGDITMATPAGKTFSVFVMVVGVTLFVRLAQAIFNPQRVRYTCSQCGLTRHDVDAVHCKHCGGQLKIRTSGVE
ncbi:ion channel [Phaeobacter inhibens]|uniref:ion channel n=1 Tax=Phaeobacter inhibens TaxID=221822 RepID=UPI000C9D0FBA|nr:ion channel [Phaeobacter inhibens]AUQ57675.1 ion channel domain-containing protein [Phaeobacter inhibens]AUR06956.1 ion channel domain-containing protein [Phaeobacter inhibens]UWR77103.1 ion transporter [Phaeobacter inhibens]